jgi:hypothetical protein
MLLVMGSTLGVAAAGVSAWGALHPSYPDTVLAPAQQELAQDHDALKAAQAAAAAGDYTQAKAILEQVKRNQTAFVRQVMDPNSPQAPELKEVQAGLRDLYATLGGGLDSAIRCMDDLQAGAAAARSAACAHGQATLGAAPGQAQALADQVAALRQRLAS